MTDKSTYVPISLAGREGKRGRADKGIGGLDAWSIGTARQSWPRLNVKDHLTWPPGHAGCAPVLLSRNVDPLHSNCICICVNHTTNIVVKMSWNIAKIPLSLCNLPTYTLGDFK